MQEILICPRCGAHNSASRKRCCCGNELSVSKNSSEPPEESEGARSINFIDALSIGKFLILTGATLAIIAGFTWIYITEEMNSLAGDAQKISTQLFNEKTKNHRADRMMFWDNNRIENDDKQAESKTNIAAAAEKTVSISYELNRISRFKPYVSAAFFVGVACMVLGYAQLFLEKQVKFEQHVAEQMTIMGHGYIEANRLAEGAQMVGDRTNVGGDVIGGAVGRGARLTARDVTAYKQQLDQSTSLDVELKEALAAARDEIEKLPLPAEDKEEVTDDLGKVTEQMSLPNPDKGRIERLLDRMKATAPTVVGLIESASRIARILKPS